MTATQRLVARVLALAGAYFSVSLLERVAAHAEQEAAVARLAAHAADAALFDHLTGAGCSCAAEPAGAGDELLRRMYAGDSFTRDDLVDAYRRGQAGVGE